MYKRVLNKLRGKNARRGFTMTELLTVVGIIAIVCAIAIPSAIAIHRSLTFRENNDYAKSVFMAAQANLTEMRSEGSLVTLNAISNPNTIPADAGLPDEAGAEEYRFTTSKGETNAAYGLLLPASSIDSKVRDGNVLIEYNPISGNVYAVFYLQKGDPLSYTTVDKDGNPIGSIRYDDAARKKIMLGYYDGSILQNSKLKAEDLEASIGYEDGEEFTVYVSIPVPKKYMSNPNTFIQGLDVSFTVEGKGDCAYEYKGQTIEKKPVTVVAKTAGNLISDYAKTEIVDGRVIISYVLDSLKDKGSFANLAYGDTAEYLNSKVSNLAKSTPKSAAGEGGKNANTCLTDISVADMSKFKILPGDNVSIEATVRSNATKQDIKCGVIDSVNPMLGGYEKSKSTAASADKNMNISITNGRTLQNLNAIAPTVAQNTRLVSFVNDIYWNKTANYYNNKYAHGGTYENNAAEAPARCLPYFVPINNENLFGAASFIYPNDTSLVAKILGDIGIATNDALDRINNTLLGRMFGWLFKIEAKPDDASTVNAVNELFDLDKDTPTLTDELDTGSHAAIDGRDYENNKNHAVYYLNINTQKYATCKQNIGADGYYAGCTAGMAKNYQDGSYASDYKDDSFAGLFGYANTTIQNLDVVNPLIKGAEFAAATRAKIAEFSAFNKRLTWSWDININRGNNPCAGALVGCAGYNTYINNCGAYIDTMDPDFMWRYMNQTDYSTGDATFYGVSGCGAVGGLIGYAKSHRTLAGELNAATASNKTLAFCDSFASLYVSGRMRGASNSDMTGDRYYGYTNGVGGFVGNAELTNFYNCYSGSNVMADGVYISDTSNGRTIERGFSKFVKGVTQEILSEIGDNPIDLPFNGRTSMGAGGLVGTSHGSKYTNCFTAGNVSASNTQSNSLAGMDLKAYGCAGFVGVMSFQEGFAYGNDTDEKVSIEQSTQFINCYCAGATKMDKGDGDGETDTSENFVGAQARINTSLSNLATYWNGNFYDVYAPAWFNGETKKSGKLFTATIPYLYHGTTKDGPIDTDPNPYSSQRTIDIETLDSNSYVFKDSYYLYGYTPTTQKDYARCGLPIMYEYLENLPKTHTDSDWINTQIGLVKENSISKFINIVKGGEEYATASESERTSEEVGEGTNYNPALWNFGGIYFGDWINGRITWSGTDFKREGTVLINHLKELNVSSILKEAQAPYTNTTYRFEASASAAQGGLIARAILNEFADPSRRLDSHKSSIGGGYIFYFNKDMYNYRPDIKGDFWLTGEFDVVEELEKLGVHLLDPDSPEHDFAYWNYHTHFRNSLGDLQYIYEKLYNQGFNSSEWTTATAATTHTYEISAQNARYPFSVMKDTDGTPKDYYGDWIKKPVACGLAYYEYYGNGNYGFYYDSLETSTLDPSKTVLSDGYAIITADSSQKINVTAKKQLGVDGNKDLTFSINGGDGQTAEYLNSEYKPLYVTGQQVYAAHLIPWEAINACSVNENGNYYTELKVDVQITLDEGRTLDEYGFRLTADENGNPANCYQGEDGKYYATYTMYFNPNVAISQLNPENSGSKVVTEASNPGNTSVPLNNTIVIRSARQFASIHNLPTACITSSDIRFEQMVDINADAYTGETYGGSADIVKGIARNVTPIGTETAPFNASYDGGSGYTEKTALGGFTDTDPYFGYVGPTGEIRSLILRETEAKTISSSGSDAALLAAFVNGGNINNVDIDLTTGITVNAADNAGVLVGRSSGGTISNCNAVLTSMSSNAANVGVIAGRSETSKDKDNKEIGAVRNCSVTVSGTVYGGTNVGAAIGNFSGTAEGITATVGNISGSNAGGFAGLTARPEFSGSSAINNVTVSIGTTDENGSVLTNGSIRGTANAGGLIGEVQSLTNASASTVTVTSGSSISGSNAGGYVGKANGLVAEQLCSVDMFGSVSGTAMAGGAVGTATAGGFDAFVVNLGGPVTSASGMAGGFAGSCAKVVNSHVHCLPNGNDPIAITGSTGAAGFAGEITGSATNCDVTGKTAVKSENGKAAGFAVSLTGSVENCRANPVRLDGLTEDESSVEELKDAFRASKYADFKVTGTTAAGFAVDVTKAIIRSCDAVAAVDGKNKDAAGFIVNLDGESTVTTSYANTEVNGAAFIKNCADTAGAKVSDCYAWFGADGDFDTCRTYRTSYIASRTARTGTNIALYTYEDGAAVCKDLDALRQLNPSELNFDNKGNPVNIGVWKAPAADEAYPFNEIVPPEYMYPMLRAHYGDWKQPPQFSYGVAYYELTDDGQVHVTLWDMNTDSDGNGISRGLPDNTTSGKFYTETANIATNEETILSAGYAVFCSDVAQIQTINDEPYNPTDDDKLLNVLSREHADQCEGEIKLNLDNLSFEESSISYQLVDEELKAFNDTYSFYIINKDAVRPSGAKAPFDGSIVVKGINSVNADGVETNKVRIQPGFANDVLVYDVQGANATHNERYEVRTGDQFGWIGTKSDKTIEQTHDLSLSGKDGNIAKISGGTPTFTGKYSAGKENEHYTIEVGDVTNAIFCEVVGGSIRNVEISGTDNTLTGTAKDLASAGLLANEVSSKATISNIEFTECSMLYCNSAGHANASFGLVAGKVADSTISKITVENANVSYDKENGAENGTINVGTVVGAAEKSTLECINVTGEAVRVLGDDPSVVEYDYVTGISYETDDVKNNAVNIGGIVGSMVNSELVKGNTVADTNSVTQYKVVYSDNAKGQDKTELKNYVNVGGAVGAATGTKNDAKSNVKNIDVVGTTVTVNSKAPVQNERDKDGNRIFGAVFNVAGIVGEAQGYTEVDGSVSSYKIENDKTTETDDVTISSAVNTDVIYGIVYSGGLAGYVEEHSTVGGHKEADVKYPSVVSDVHFTTLADYSGGVHVGSAVGALDGTLVYCDISGTVFDIECSKEGYTPVGGAAGQTNPTGNLSNTTAAGVSISAKSCNQDVIVGGLVGLATAGSTVSGTVTDPQFGELLVLENGHDTDIYVGGLVGDARGTLKNSSVSIGEMTVDISDDNVSDNRISDGINHVHELFVGGLAGRTDVAEISEGSVFKCDVSAEKITVIKGSHDTEVNIGGAVGKNVEGLITNINQEGASANKVNIDYKPNGSKDKVDIGGLIGEMQSSKTNGGGLGSANISGEITLNGDTKLTGNYTVGGAVGTENNGGASYTNVTATVKIDKDWAGTTTDRHNSPAQLGKVGKFVGYADNGKFKNCNGNGTDDDSNVKYQFLGEVFANAPQISSGLYAAKNGSGTLQNLTGTITARSATNGGTPMYGDISFTPADTSTKIYSYNLTLDNCHYLTGGADKLQTIGQDKWFYGASKYNEKVDQYHLEKATSISSSSEYLICEGNDAMTARKQTADRFTTTSIAQYADGSSFDNSKYNALANSIWHITGNGSYFTASKVVNKGVSDYDLRYIATTDNINFHLGIGGTSKDPTIRYNSDTGLWAIYHAWDYLDWFTRTYCAGHLKINGDSSVKKTTDKSKADSIIVYDKTIYEVIHSNDYESVFSPSAICYIIN